MNIKRFFLRKTSLFVFIVTFWTKISVFQKLQFIIPRAYPGPQKSLYLRTLWSNIHQFAYNVWKKNYLNKMKLKWQNCLKQKSYRTERKFIKLRQEAKRPLSWHHDGDSLKGINYIFSLRAAFMECLSQ